MIKKTAYICIVIILTIIACSKKESVKHPQNDHFLKQTANVLSYRITPKNSFDKSGLMFSDQGAWFAYSMSDSITNTGFSGPFLMTEQNGVWAGNSMATLILEAHSWKRLETKSYPSHLEQVFSSKNLTLTQQLYFLSGHTAFIKYTLKNISDKAIVVQPQLLGSLFKNGLSFRKEKNNIQLVSEKTTAKGFLKFITAPKHIEIDSLQYSAHFDEKTLAPNKEQSYTVTQSFIFPEYSWESEEKTIEKIAFDTILKQRIQEKKAQLTKLWKSAKTSFSDSIHKQVLSKAYLTLQNNWRIPAGEITHAGLFPSYHYKWFNGFWSWDSWKHAVGLSYYDTTLAKEQLQLMFAFQKANGFIPDCVFRDTTIEAHNYRDTKPPLSAWAVAKIFQKDKDTVFVQNMYPKLKKYHHWWYKNRDHDLDGLCEYGSTDGSLVAAKWESGMDNAIRFDNSKMLKNSDDAYSLNQESVDLNAYLYAEKLFLAELANTLNLNEEATFFLTEATNLKSKIQQQFYSIEDGWFYDTSLDGKTFIKGEGSEGWTALWAKVASQEQAEAVKNKMMNPKKFFTKIPFQTMSADHPKFNPLKGYWRGPNWLDQAYFGIEGLRNYGFAKEATTATQQILLGCEGLLTKGASIRENYHPITGKGLNAQNFSWSAAHVIMMLAD